MMCSSVGPVSMSSEVDWATIHSLAGMDATFFGAVRAAMFFGVGPVRTRSMADQAEMSFGVGLVPIAFVVAPTTTSAWTTQP